MNRPFAKLLNPLAVLILLWLAIFWSYLYITVQLQQVFFYLYHKPWSELTDAEQSLIQVSIETVKRKKEDIAFVQLYFWNLAYLINICAIEIELSHKQYLQALGTYWCFVFVMFLHNPDQGSTESNFDV